MNNKTIHTGMFRKYLFAAAFLFLSGSTLLGQNEVKNYDPPPVIKGSTFQVQFSSDFSTLKNINDSASDYNINLHSNIYYNRWKLTRKLNYAMAFNANLNYYKSKYAPEIDYDVREYTSSTADLKLIGGASYYFLRNIYAGTSSNIGTSFGLHYNPYVHMDFYPSLGYGRVVDAGQISEASNLEKALIEEKIISSPLPADVRKELVEILDRRNNTEYSAKYKDDADIAFYSDVEKLLLERKVISTPLGSRAVLKLFQALTNTKFVYFPKYMGWQVQGELDYLVRNEQLSSENTDSRLSTITFGGIYGLPVSNKLGLLLSLFYSHNISNAYFTPFGDYNFHSPLTIAASNQLGIYDRYSVPHSRIYAGYTDYTYRATASIVAFYTISRFAGILLNSQGDIAGTKSGKTESSLNVRADLLYYVLSKMALHGYLSFTRDYETYYDLFGGFGISYTIF